MKIKSVKISEKGQIAIPLDIREELGLKKGDELLIVQEGNKMLLEKPEKKAFKHEFEDLVKMSEKTAKKLWENKDDEIWNDV